MNALGLHELRTIPSLLPTFQPSTHSFPRKQGPQITPTPEATTVQTMQIRFFPSINNTTQSSTIYFKIMKYSRSLEDGADYRECDRKIRENIH